MKNVIVSILALAILVALFVGFFPRESSPAEFPYGRAMAGIEVLLEPSAVAVSQRSLFRITAGEVEGLATLIPVANAELGSKAVEAQLFGVKSAFQERPAPYSGQITKSIACDSQKYLKEQFIPFGGSGTRLILAVASGRRVYGSCAAEEIKYASVFSAAFDPERMQVVTIKLFKPATSPEQIISSQAEMLGVLRALIAHP